jgi:capsular exopolysaccharide synthesis family protein
MLPEFPSKPKKVLILMMSVAIGLGIGLSYALGASLLDSSLKTVDQAEQVLGLNLLGAIPTAKDTALEKTRRMLIENPDSAIAETFRAMRTAVQLAAPDDAFRCMLVTSGIPGEGKSFCAINYAVTLAQQGFRTLLIDADLRLPSVGRVFLGKDEVPGVTDLLLERRDFDEVVQLTNIENLSILPAGARVSNPAELCNKASFAALIEAAKARFDRIVIDTAPVHAVSETLILAPQADAVCLIVRAGKTPAPVAVRALKKLIDSGANIPGFVLNGVSNRNKGYYYHYHAPGYGKDEVYGASAAAARRARGKS